MTSIVSKGNKYHAKRTTVDGITFASKKEADRYCQLLLLQKAGKIKSLQLQVPYTLIEKSKYGRKIVYIADFVYRENDQIVVEDTKGFKNPTYKLKARMMAEIYGIEIKET